MARDQLLQCLLQPRGLQHSRETHYKKTTTRQTAVSKSAVTPDQPRLLSFRQGEWRKAALMIAVNRLTLIPACQIEQ